MKTATKTIPPSQRPVVNPNNLKTIREGMGLDVYQFCLMLGHKLANYYRLEQGTQMPKAATVREICLVLKLSQAEVFPVWIAPRNGRE
jgi:transcriptional regulator with XRE-family HTH domain